MNRHFVVKELKDFETDWDSCILSIIVFIAVFDMR
jgi:hypothetical protein